MSLWYYITIVLSESCTRYSCIALVILSTTGTRVLVLMTGLRLGLRGQALGCAGRCSDLSHPTSVEPRGAMHGMQAKMHIYMHAYMPVCIHTYMHVCIHIHVMHAFIHRMHIYTHACMHSYIHEFISTYMHPFINALHAFIYTRMYA